MFKIRRSSWLLLALLVTVTILIACFIPARNVPDVDIPLMDKWVHITVFAAFAFCWSGYFSRTHLAGKAVLILGCAAFGLGIEMVQGSGWISNRSFEWSDFFADLAGAVTGTWVYSALMRWLRQAGKAA